MTPTDKNAIITTDISTEHRERVRMNKLSKFLWGILSFGISAIYRVDTNAAHHTDLAGLTNAAIGDTVNVDCGVGDLVLNVVGFYNNDNNSGQYDNITIPRESHCYYIEDYLCETTTNFINKCGANQTATPGYASAVDPNDFNCTALTCPNGGTLGALAETQTETLNQNTPFGCQRKYTGGSGNRFLTFSFTISAITASSGWYGSYTSKKTGSNWNNISYTIRWQRVNNNSINDCYIAPGTYTDGNGNTYQYVDNDNKCYYKG